MLWRSIQIKKRRNGKNIGWISLFLAIGFFCLQMGFLLVQNRFQVEYVDDRLFYFINIVCVLFLASALLCFITISKKWKWLGATIVIIFVMVNVFLLVKHNQEIQNFTRLSADMNHILSLKQNKETGEVIYYRSIYGMLARPKEKLPGKIAGTSKIKWLENDIAAITYRTRDQKLQQFIATYGDRGSGSYYYVGAEIYGQWHGNGATVIGDTNGITVIKDGKTELFDWDHVIQYGTLAIVLMENDEAAWTISLNQNFRIHSEGPPSGEIRLYQATMEKNKPITLLNSRENL
ncbi:hypothetical protein J2Z23_003088 [Lederbergia galactosidilyticus]|nr:hypothetical protein [Lederbergia galactosidilytica]